MGSDKLFHKRKEKSANALARRTAIKSPYETVLIICEGEKTEVEYFLGLVREKKLNTANIQIMPAKGSAPKNIVEFAIKLAEDNEGIDRVFCVFDRDEHSSFDFALNMIKNYKPNVRAKSKPKYQAIVSFPCFELWLLLHFTYTTKGYFRTQRGSASDNLISELCNHIPKYDKKDKNLFIKTSNYLAQAIKHAKRLKKYNSETDSNHTETNVYELVEYLLKLK